MGWPRRLPCDRRRTSVASSRLRSAAVGHRGGAGLPSQRRCHRPSKRSRPASSKNTGGGHARMRRTPPGSSGRGEQGHFARPRHFRAHREVACSENTEKAWGAEQVRGRCDCLSAWLHPAGRPKVAATSGRIAKAGLAAGLRVRSLVPYSWLLRCASVGGQQDASASIQDPQAF